MSYCLCFGRLLMWFSSNRYLMLPLGSVIRQFRFNNNCMNLDIAEVVFPPTWLFLSSENIRVNVIFVFYDIILIKFLVKTFHLSCFIKNLLCNVYVQCMCRCKIFQPCLCLYSIEIS